MNKSEKLICLILGAILVWWIWSGTKDRAKATAAQREAAMAAAATNVVASVSTNAAAVQAVAPVAEPPPAVPEAKQFEPSEEEVSVVLENNAIRLELSSWGAVVKKATLKEYAKALGSEERVELDFSTSPLGQLTGVEGLHPNESYRILSQTPNEVVFTNAFVVRKVTLGADYQITYDETFPSASQQATSLSLGVMHIGDSKNDLLSVDSKAVGTSDVMHHGDDGDSPLKRFLANGSGGCSGAPDATGMPEISPVTYPGGQSWVAVKNRFFVTAFVGSDCANSGFDAKIARDTNKSTYQAKAVSAEIRFNEVVRARKTVFYVGPKKQSLLWDLEMKDVMEFGMWRWLCYPIVAVLNFFYALIPNYGVAIILLTILVRLIFWPLTRKSTIGMKKMQELQPKMKAIQAQFKDNPQRLQQETWALYRTEKVNPLSSCLPMLIQIPVFIALFNVLRSAVELRYAPFLWISDLSEPEALFASWFPFGGLNILPIAMAVTTGLQSAFTPSAGDKGQQKMMMIFMPAMMLFMFYSFPSALSLYWFLSNLFSIAQMWLIRRSTAKEQAAKAVFPDQIIDPPTTRQMRRHS